MSARRLLTAVAVASCAAICVLVPAGSASAVELPDGRVYELVSSLGRYNTEAYQPRYFTPGADYSSQATILPFQSSADGDRVIYPGGPSVGGNELSGEDGGNEYLASRSPSGSWTQSNLSPAGASSAIYQAFSSDLSSGLVDAVQPLSPAAPGFGEPIPQRGSYDILYSTNTNTDEYFPLITTTPPYRSKEDFQTASIQGSLFNTVTNGGRNSRALVFAGASTDRSHLLFLANDALTGAAEGRPAAEGGAGAAFETDDNLYESYQGQLRLVNVLPNGTTHVNATFGGGVSGEYGSTEKMFSHVISNDGSKIFWTDVATGHIYVREDGAATVEISPAGKYQTATSDGSAVFYTNGDLYRYELENAQTTDLTPGVAVAKVVGSSENGEYVYYVTNGGEFKLWHNGVTAPIAAAAVTRGEVAADGHSVVFVSSEPDVPESIHVYDADTGSVYCASCASGGSKGILMSTNPWYVYLPRWISADGSRVFFDSNEGLVPQDTNGKFDVYEWERPGFNGCGQGGGCIFLLSEGTSTQDATFADASENGSDVFFVTRAKLLSSDEGELFDLYDARVDGSVPAAPPVCTGSGCQGLPSAPPIFATPSSVTFAGIGNFTGGEEVKAKPKPKKKTKKKPKHKRKNSKVKKSARKANGRGRSGSKGGRS